MLHAGYFVVEDDKSPTVGVGVKSPRSLREPDVAVVGGLTNSRGAYRPSRASVIFVSSLFFAPLEGRKVALSKSMMVTWPASSTRRFPGLKSLWRTSASCMDCIA